MSGSEYECAVCHGVFESEEDWTDEDRIAEMEINFGEVPESERESVCDVCYRKMVKLVPPHHDGAVGT